MREPLKVGTVSGKCTLRDGEGFGVPKVICWFVRGWETVVALACHVCQLGLVRLGRSSLTEPAGVWRLDIVDDVE